ncbi:MAG TPA: hypothetical protein VFH94_06585, partial [Streptomyces sp.]|nr:hypothetical protein [Streptomyces sp.]
MRVLTGADSPLAADGEQDRVDEWRAITLPDGTQAPFVMPLNGFHVRNIIGAERILAASTIALGKAYDNRLSTVTGELTGDELDEVLRKARITPLTAEGTGSAQVLEDSHGTGALTVAFEQASSGGGYQTSGLTDNSLTDRTQGSLTLFSRPDFAGAQLLAVADGARMESPTRRTQSDNETTAQGGDSNIVFGASPALKSDAVGATNPGASGTGTDTTETDGRVFINEQTRQVNLKPNTGRVFAFVIPTAWLSVGDVERQFKDNSVATWTRKHLMGSLGGIKPGPHAAEAQTHVIAWVREDIARRIGLITEENFPKRLAEAWDKVKDSATDWAEQDEAYWALRRGIPDLKSAIDLAVAERSLARRRRRTVEAAAGAEIAAAQREFAVAARAADAARNQPPEGFSPAIEGYLRSAEAAAVEAHEELRSALLDDLLSDSAAPAASRAAAERRVDTARQAQEAADRLVDAVRQAERDRRIAEAVRIRDGRTAAAAESTSAARAAVRAAVHALRTAEGALQTRLDEVKAQELKAESAAEDLHHLRAGTDRLTHWHRLAEDPPSGVEGAPATRAGLPEPTVTDRRPAPEGKTRPSRHSTKPKAAQKPGLDSIAEEGGPGPGASRPKPSPHKRRSPASNAAKKPGLAPIAEDPASDEGSVDPEFPTGAEPSIDPEYPVGVEDPVGTEDSTGTGDSAGTGDSTRTGESTGTGEPTDDGGPAFQDEPSTAGKPSVYTHVTDREDGAPAVKSPAGTTHRLRDVPRDGRSFFHALRHLLPQARADHADALRARFADRLAALPLDSPLLAYLSPDETDTFTAAELRAAGIDLGTNTPQSREFGHFGVIPHSAGDRPTADRRHRPLTAAQRRGLALAQLRRPAGAAKETGWDHSAADVLPALAAQMYDVGVRVVREDGAFQDYSPDPDRPLPADAPRVVLHLADRHFRSVAAESVAEGPPAVIMPPAPKPVDESLLTTHSTRPWTWDGLDEATYAGRPRFDAATDLQRLTDPDGYVYELFAAQGGGNRFHAALEFAMSLGDEDGPRYSSEDLAASMDSVSVPRTARLDPRATFTVEELEEAGFPEFDEGLQREFERGGGRPPASLSPVPRWVEENLIRIQLRTARRWNKATALLAAELTARELGLHVTYVHENGTIDTFGAARHGFRNAVVVYERGDEFLAAVPNGPRNPRGPLNHRDSTFTPPPTRPAPTTPALAVLPATGPAGGKGAPKPRTRTNGSGTTA